MQKISIFLLSAFALMSADAMAQENKRVEVTSVYNPEVVAAEKLLSPTEIDDTPMIEPTIEYNVEPATWQIGLQAHDFKPATATYWDFTRSKSFFLKAGAGYPLTSDFIFRYSFVNPDESFFGVGLSHMGDFAAKRDVEGVKQSMGDSFDMQNRLDVFGGAYLGERLLEVGATSSYDLYHTYPSVDHNLELPTFDAGLKVRYGDDFADLSRLNFSFEAHGDYMNRWQPASIVDETSTMSMVNAGGSARLGRLFSDNRIEVDGGYDIWIEPWKGGYRDSRFWVGAEYARSFGIVDVEAGVKYMRDKVRDRAKASHFIMPSAKVVLDLQRAAFAPYIELRTTVSQNSRMSLLKQNPYLDIDAEVGDAVRNYASMPNTRSYDLSLGFSGRVFATRLAYRAYAGVSFMRDRVFWFVTRPGLFGVSTSNATQFYAGVEVEYQPVAGLDINLGFNANGIKSNSPYLYSDPKMSGDLKVAYTLKRWNFYASAEMLGARKFSGMVDANGVAPELFSVKTKFDLCAGVSYRATRGVEVYVDGLNLLNSDLYDFANYYRNGAGFKAGVMVHF